MRPPTISNSADVSPSPKFNNALHSQQPRLFLDLFAGHSAPLTVAGRAANLDHFTPFDFGYNSNFDILNDMQFETVLQMVHSGIVGAIWSAPRCRLYSNLRQNDGGPPPLSFKYKNLKRSTDDHLCFVLLFFNREALQEKNNLSIPSLGRNLSINNFCNSVPAILLPLQHANGA